MVLIHGDTEIIKQIMDPEVSTVDALKNMKSCEITQGPLFVHPDALLKLPTERSPVSYSYINRELHVRLQTQNITSLSKIGTHSFRVGAATATARIGVPERLIQSHGRWLSDRVRIYIRESEKEISMA